MEHHKTLMGNWYEETYFHADERYDKLPPRTRPMDDEIENIPRITRVQKPTGEIFRLDDIEPEERFETETMRAYGPKTRDISMNETITEQRMNCTPEHLREILSVEPSRYIPNYETKEITPEDQFKTVSMETYTRKL